MAYLSPHYIGRATTNGENFILISLMGKKKAIEFDIIASREPLIDHFCRDITLRYVQIYYLGIMKPTTINCSEISTFATKCHIDIQKVAKC